MRGGRGISGRVESEAEVSEGAVCLGHLVHVLLALESTALVVESVHDLGGELVAHGLATALAGVVDRSEERRVGKECRL